MMASVLGLRSASHPSIWAIRRQFFGDFPTHDPPQNCASCAMS